MATAALSIGALALATPVTTAPAAKLSIVASNPAPLTWTQDRRARLLLASCVENPPVGAWTTTRYIQSADHTFAYVGYRAEALAAIREEHGRQALLAYERDGESAYPAFAAWCRAPSVTDAIDAALNASLDLAWEA